MKKALLLALLLTLFSRGPVAAQTNPSLSVSPTSQTAPVNSNANVAINVVNSPEAFVYQFSINYNPTYLSINSAADVTLGTLFPAGSFVSVDLSQNATGKAVIGVSAMTMTPVTGSAPLVNIRFTTKAVSGSSNLTLSEAFYNNTSWDEVTITSLTNGSLTVGSAPTATPAPTNTPVPPTNTPVPPTNTPVPPTSTPVPPSPTTAPSATPTPVNSLTFDIRLEGIVVNRPPQPIRVTFKHNTNNTTLFTQTVTASTGIAPITSVYRGTVTGFAAGTYKVCFKASTHLQECFPNTALSTGVNNRDFYQGLDSNELWAGDVNDDNMITLLDITAILSPYGRTDRNNDPFAYPVIDPAGTNHLYHLDIDKDGYLTIQDIALAAYHYTDFNITGDE